MTKYKKYYKMMVEQNTETFDSFRNIHDAYALDQDKNQKQFNTEGEKVLELMREWENKLCMQSEKGGYGHFTTNLAEKFKAEVRKDFPEIDNVGVIIQEPTKNDFFTLKKINLS